MNNYNLFDNFSDLHDKMIKLCNENQLDFSLTKESFPVVMTIKPVWEIAAQEKIFSEIIKQYNQKNPDSDIKTKEIVTDKNKLKNTINYPIIILNTKLKVENKEYYLIRVIPEEVLMTDKKNKKEI